MTIGNRRSLVVYTGRPTLSELAESRRRLALLPKVRRPKTRAECVAGGWNAKRPCPFATCRYHLAVEVTSRGHLLVNFPNMDADELPETCALDVADRGEHTLATVGEMMNMTRERARQIEEEALARVPKEEL